MDDGVIAWLGRVATAPATVTVGAVMCAFILGRLIVGIARPLLARIAGRTANEWDDRLVELMASPLSLVLGLQALAVASPWLPLDGPALATLHGAIAIVTTLAVLWTAFRGIDPTRTIHLPGGGPATAEADQRSPSSR